MPRFRSASAAALAALLVLVSPGPQAYAAAGRAVGARASGAALPAAAVVSLDAPALAAPPSFRSLPQAPLPAALAVAGVAASPAPVAAAAAGAAAADRGAADVASAAPEAAAAAPRTAPRSLSSRVSSSSSLEQLRRWLPQQRLEPAMRVSKDGLSVAEHKKVVNPIIEEAFKNGRARLLEPGGEEHRFYDPKGALSAKGVKLYVIDLPRGQYRAQAKLLAAAEGIIPPLDVVAHPSAKRSQVYFFGHYAKDLARLSEGQRAEIAEHELAHVLDPSASEERTQEKFPLPQVKGSRLMRLMSPLSATWELALNLKTMVRGDEALRPLISKYKKRINLVRGLLFVDALLYLGLGYLLGRVVDIAGGELIPRPLVPFFSFFALTALTNLLYFFNEFAHVLLEDITGYRVVKDLRKQFFAHTMSLGMGFFHEQKPSALSPRLSEDIHLLQEKNLEIPIKIPFHIAQLLFAGTLLLWTNWQVGGLIVATLPLFAYLTSMFSNRMERVAEHYMDARSEMIGYAGNVFSIMDVVKIFGIESQVTGHFGDEADKLRVVGEKRAWLEAKYHVSVSSLGDFSTKILIVFLGTLSLFFLGHPTIGTILALQSYALMFQGAIEGLSSDRTEYAAADGGSQRVLEILAMKPEIQDAPDAEPLGPLQGRIEFKDVTFSYDGKTKVLNKASFTIEPGQKVAFVGASGSGKTTVIRLLSRLHDPTEGSVLVDGHDLKTVQRASLTSRLAIVPQEGGLFKGTIRDNLLAVQPSAQPAQIDAALDAAQAAFVRDSAICPKGLDTDIETLSGGQRQRVAIARAVLRNPSILFLDEATSALDNETEGLVQTSLDELMKGRTTIMVAHRLTTIQKADKIFFLEKGRIVESGTHDELMGKNGKYYRLWMKGQKSK